MSETRPTSTRDLRILLDESAAELLRLDRARLAAFVNRIEGRARENQPVDRMVRRWEADYLAALDRRVKRDPAGIARSYPRELPISERRNDILDALARHQVVIVCGDTGSGKTTQLPKLVLETTGGDAGRIGCTQPRRLAAVSMARRVAEETRCPLGGEIGYQVRFDNKTSETTVIKFMTDGILLTEMLHDHALWQYEAIMVDEAHERSLNIDFIFGYLKNLLPRRPDLKILISSATLDADRFSAFFHDAPVISVQGRTYPIEDLFFPPQGEDEELSAHIARAVAWINDIDREGDILVFLPGEREIHDAADALRGKRYPATEILPLYARLQLADQQRVFRTGGDRRIVLATNVAETSLTIPGIRYVVDSGLVRISRFHPRRKVQTLQIESASQAAVKQRRGRCGRVANGVCLHLYHEEDLAERDAYTDPEIRRTTLAGVILQMAVLRLPAVDVFPFLDPPKPAAIREGYRTLTEIGAVDGHRRVTRLGRELARFPVDPHVARMILYAREEGVVDELLAIGASLSIQDPRERPADRKEAADLAHAAWRDDRSDFLSNLNLWRAWQDCRAVSSRSAQRRWCSKNMLSHRRMMEWQNLYQELLDLVRGLKWDVNRIEDRKGEPDADAVHRSILAGVPMHCGRRDERKEFLGPRGARFNIFPGSGLFASNPEWVVAFSLMETSRVYAHTVARIQPTWIEDVAPHLTSVNYYDVQWDADQGFVYARANVVCGGLTIAEGRRVHYGPIRPDVAREIFIREGLVPAHLRSRGRWLKEYRRRLAIIETLEQKIRRPHGLRNDQGLYEHFDALLPADVYATRDLDQWMHKTGVPIMPAADRMMVEPEDTDLAVSHPDELVFHGHVFPVAYAYAPGEDNDGIVLTCPVRDLARLPSWAPDWVVPGWLPEKIRALIRCLPKSLRQACQPVDRTVEDFLVAVQNDTVDRRQALLRALSTFLFRQTGHHVGPDDFDLERLPRHLHMKVAVVDDDGNCIGLRVGKPDPAEYPAGSAPPPAPASDLLQETGMTSWTGPALPDHIQTTDSSGPARGYPALVDEGDTVGIRCFGTEDEAADHHVEGLIRLFRLEHADQVKYLEKRMPIPSPTQLSLCALDRPGRHTLHDFVDRAIAIAIRGGESSWPRGPERAGTRIREARGTLFAVAADLGQSIAEVMKLYDETRASLTRTSTDESTDDITEQLNWLFRPGFPRDGIFPDRYPRYLRAIGVRLERIGAGSGKDAGKLAAIRPYQEKQDALASSIGEGRMPGPILRFATLLQEYRIAQFAPELKPHEKVSPKRLDAVLHEIEQAVITR